MYFLPFLTQSFQKDYQLSIVHLAFPKFFILLIGAIILSGCSAFSTLPMPIALFRSPVTVSLPNINSPISAEEKCRLNLVGREISSGQPRNLAIEKYWYAKKVSPLLRVSDIKDWPGLLLKLKSAGIKDQPNPGKRIWELLSQGQSAIENSMSSITLQEEQKSKLTKALNEKILASPDFYQERYFSSITITEEDRRLLNNQANLSSSKVQSLNRHLIESAYPHEIAKSPKFFGPCIFIPDPNSISDNQSMVENNFDTLEDLLNSETVVLVSFSGGGARAASMAKHSMALLERYYNEISLNLGITTNPPLISIIDAYSSVSGGSFYSHLVATSKSSLDRYRTLQLFDCDEKNPEVCEFIPRSQEIGEVNPQAILRKCSWQEFSQFGNLEEFKKISYWEQTFFQAISNAPRPPSEVGFWSAAWYLSPGNLFAGPLVTFFTDKSYLDILAGGLNWSQKINARILPDPINDFFHSKLHIRSFLDVYKQMWSQYSEYFNPYTVKLGDLCPKPRFFFNATSLETGIPFVFTQSIINLPQEEITDRTARIDIQEPPNSFLNKKFKLKSLPTAFTLEEINSSPKGFPLAYAALASAAFPIGLEPLEILKYGYDPGYQEVYQTAERLHLSDGGIYDNSGLSTLINLVQFLRNSGKTKRVIILAINADADDYDVLYPKRVAEKEYWFNEIAPFSWFDLPISPFRTNSLGIGAFELIHFSNKRRAEELAISQVQKLVKDSKETDKFEFYYFPISLGQLSPHDRFRITKKQADGLFEKLKKIPTSYYIGEGDEHILSEAAEVIISTEQEYGWNVGPNCEKETQPAEVKNVGEAFAFALLRSHLSTTFNQDWASPFFAGSETYKLNKWCESTK